MNMLYKVAAASRRATAGVGGGLGCLIWLALFVPAGSAAIGATTPAFVQEKDRLVTTAKTGSVTFSSPTTAGNLIAVYLVWDSVITASVSDSLGNTYVSAVPSIRWKGSTYSAQIFYAFSAKAGVDTVTATFATPVNSIVYAHEYSGVSQTAPIDLTASAIGSNGTLSSGTVNTANSVDLLFAGGISANIVKTPGAGFTARSTAQGKMTEDRVVSVKGAYAATAANSGGAWAMQMVAFKGASAAVTDATPPSAPNGLSVTGATTSTVSLSWSASSDNVAVAGYKINRGGVQVGTSAVPSFTDSGLTPGTTYSYSVSAYDAAGNTSAPSTVIQATSLPLGTAPPTVPTGLSVTGTTASSVSLSWIASTGGAGVAGYKIYRGGAQVALSSGTVFSDSGLAASTTYTYAVAAYDSTGNTSTPSASVQATTQGASNPPGVSIVNPAPNATVSGTIGVAASASSSVGVANVQFRLDGANLGSAVTAAPYSVAWDTTQASNGTHTLIAVATDTAGLTGTSSGVAVTVSNGGGSGHTYTTNFSATENPISEGGHWVNGKTDGLDWADVRATPGLAYGTETGNNGFDDSTAILTGTWGPDQSCQATVHSVNQSSDQYEEVECRLRSAISAHSNTGYEINFRCVHDGTQYVQIVRWNGPLGSYTYVNTAAGPGIRDGDVVRATIVGSTITAYINNVQIVQGTDSTYTTGNPGMGFYLGGNASTSDYGFSSYTASDTSTPPPGTTGPSIPANLTASIVSSNQINLNWSPSTGSVTVTGYQVFRNNTQIGTTASPGFSDTSAVPGVQYSYTVAASDASGNVSAQSSPVVVTISSVIFGIIPSVPSSLKSSNVTSTSATISWSASTDDVAVAGYEIFRNGAQVATTTTATSYTDTGLTPSTTYAYTVAAYDGAGNVSAPSLQMMVTTAAGPTSTPSFIQENHNQISSGTSTPVPFAASTQAGNTIVVYVIWSNTGTVAVTDSLGDSFVNVGAPVTWGPGSGYSAQIFYASKIAGGANTVTAAFKNSVTSFGVVYVHEYAGISSVNPVDVTASASGSSATMNSGAATTTSPNDLIFGAGVSDNFVTAAGAGFISRDLAYGNITEDQAAASLGSYAATATHNGNMWGMQMVAFRAAQ